MSESLLRKRKLTKFKNKKDTIKISKVIEVEKEKGKDTKMIGNIKRNIGEVREAIELRGRENGLIFQMKKINNLINMVKGKRDIIKDIIERIKEGEMSIEEKIGTIMENIKSKI